MPTSRSVSASASVAERVVVNTGPLIALESAGVLGVLGRLPLEVFCPSDVVDELAVGTQRGPLPDWLHVLSLAAPLDRVALTSLDRGEAAVIQLAGEQGISLVCIDERKGRLVAEAVGLRVTGTLGLLVGAKRLGLLRELRPIVSQMVTAGTWYDAELVRRVLESVGE